MSVAGNNVGTGDGKKRSTAFFVDNPLYFLLIML